MKWFAFCFFLFSAAVAQAQVENPVAWNFSAVKTGPRTYALHMAATISGNWHLYSQQAGEGPEPTSFTFSKNPLVKWDGKVKEEGKLETAYDPNFKSNLRFYSHAVDFVQNVTVKSNAQTTVKGTVTFMVCNDRRCLPPKEIPFTIRLENK